MYEFSLTSTQSWNQVAIIFVQKVISPIICLEICIVFLSSFVTTINFYRFSMLTFWLSLVSI